MKTLTVEELNDEALPCAVCGIAFKPKEGRNVRIVTDWGEPVLQQQWHVDCAPITWRVEDDEPIAEGDLDMGRRTFTWIPYE